MAERDDQQQLLMRITERHRDVEAFLKRARPKSERLTTVSVVSSAVAAALTAGPGLGGPSFTQNVAGAFGGRDDSLVWRLLCILAMVVSVVAAISANLGKSKDAEARIIAAETSKAELEGLRTMLEFGQVSVPDAVGLYQQYVSKVAYVESTGPVGPPR